MPDNHRERDLDSMAAYISRNITESGVCELRSSELAALWGREEGLEDEQKRMCIRNFASHYNFAVVIDYGLAYAVFR